MIYRIGLSAFLVLASCSSAPVSPEVKPVVPAPVAVEPAPASVSLDPAKVEAEKREAAQLEAAQLAVKVANNRATPEEKAKLEAYMRGKN